MNFTDQLARRAIVILMILTLANLFASWNTAQTVHRVEKTLSEQAAAAAKAAEKTATAAQQAASAVQDTAESAKDASATVSRAARSLCSASHVDCAQPPYAGPAAAVTAPTKP